MKDMLTFGESYMAGLWDVEDLEQTLYDMSRERTFRKMLVPRRGGFAEAPSNLRDSDRSIDVIDHHYDLGNDLFEAMLGETMAYTCAYWPSGVDNLDDAQRSKLQMVADKIELQSGMTVLDLGCGFHAFAKYISEKPRYAGVKVHGITLSEEQARVAREYGTVDICDYREAKGKYDRVVSLGLLEHIGYDNYKTFFKVISRCMNQDGIALVHSIGHNASHKTFNPWINKHIFPNGMLPSLKQIAEATERLFTIEDVHNIGTHYPQTLRAWWENCENSELYRSGKYSTEFWRKWKFYLLFSAASFRARAYQLYHVVLTKGRLEQPMRIT
ncbi:MAG: class I SAM-dependent methyltransferase [Acidimicrobiia bacterium]|nr:class I SAM-dependent methyltransferase [Acidimicrobiia bacterium]